MKYYEELVRNGPLTEKEMGVGGGLSVDDRERGARKFRLYWSTGARGMSGNDQSQVWYLPDRHHPSEVVNKWVVENQHIVDESNPRSILLLSSEYGDEFREALKEHVEPIVTNPVGGSGNHGGTCPLCGAEYSRHLPDHLPCNDSD